MDTLGGILFDTKICEFSWYIVISRYSFSRIILHSHFKWSRLFSLFQKVFLCGKSFWGLNFRDKEILRLSMPGEEDKSWTKMMNKVIILIMRGCRKEWRISWRFDYNFRTVCTHVTHVTWAFPRKWWPKVFQHLLASKKPIIISVAWFLVPKLSKNKIHWANYCLFLWDFFRRQEMNDDYVNGCTQPQRFIAYNNNNKIIWNDIK